MKTIGTKSQINLRTMIPSPGTDLSGARAAFALIALGVIETIELGLLDTESAIPFFFHADNALFVRKEMRDKLAADVIGRGLQLSDLFTVLEPADANRALREQLAAMRAACRSLLGKAKLAA